MKMIFLLQRVFGFDCDYALTVYTYGFSCADVACDLGIVEGFGGAEINYNPGYGGPGAANGELRRRGAEFLEQITGALDQLVADYGHASAKDLELRSTIVYMVKPERSNEELVRLVHEVKPHFSKAQIEAVLGELDGKGYLARASTSARTIAATS